MLAAGSSEAALAFIEIGAVVLALAILSRLAGRIGITAVPLYLIAGLVVGEGGVVTLDVSEEFISLAAEIGVLLLLLALGLEYNEAELRTGLRTGLVPGVTDMVLNAVPGVILGLLLGWTPLAAVLLGGVCWVSSSGIISKVLSDLGRLGFRETPTVLNMLVIEDLAMAVYLPIVAALIAGGTVAGLLGSVGLAITAVAVVLVLAVRYGSHLSDVVAGGSDESLLLTVFGMTLLVGGLAQRIEVSGAIGAFLVGLALSGRAEERAVGLDRAAARPVRRHVLPVLLVPDRSVRPRRRGSARPRARHRHVDRQGRHRLDRGRAGRCRTPRPGARRHGADRPRRVLDRHRRPRLRARRRSRSRCARGRLRVDHGDRRPAGDEIRRLHPDPRPPRRHRNTGAVNATNGPSPPFGHALPRAGGGR